MQHLLPHPKHKGDEKEWQDEGKQNSPATDAVLSLNDYCLTYFVVNTVCLYPNKSILAVGSSAKVFRMTPSSGCTSATMPSRRSDPVLFPFISGDTLNGEGL